jgi:hypothetical protein
VAVSIERQAMQALAPAVTFYEKLNGQWHRPALRVFMLIVLGHWAEHLAQAVQIYVLGWPVPEARGVLGLWYPWLVKSELLHYLYALAMLTGLWTLREGFRGLSYKWWVVALGIQFWHHIEHALLIGQALSGHNLFGSPVPTSIVQLLIPRVELHLFYNTIVFIPMIAGMYYHLSPPEGEEPSRGCSCAVRQESIGVCSV